MLIKDEEIFNFLAYMGLYCTKKTKGASKNENVGCNYNEEQIDFHYNFEINGLEQVKLFLSEYKSLEHKLKQYENTRITLIEKRC